VLRYKLFFIRPSPRHVRKVLEFEAPDDHRAREIAHARHEGDSMELWRDDQLIHAFEAR
jgi:hypothetical protein